LNILNDFIQSIEVVDRQAFKNLSLCFVRNKEKQDVQIRNYAEALQDKSLVVTEVDEGGNVPELRFINKGDMPIFVPEGTIIMGLKQSRTIRVSFVINQRQEIIAPVHCVEQSRWAFNSKVGNKSPFHLYSRLRASNLRHTRDSLRAGEGFHSKHSQGDTWQNIRATMQRMNVESETGFAGDIYESNKESIDGYLKAFRVPETANGFLTIIDNHMVAMDVFATQALFQGNFQSLLSGTVLDAIDKDYCRELQNQKVLTVEQFLQSIQNSKKETFTSVGHGEDVRFEGNSVLGSALINNHKVIHVEAFAEVV
jgi:ARG and Rhodanese-Phosphatase-superfamily-associated Protein domain